MSDKAGCDQARCRSLHDVVGIRSEASTTTLRLVPNHLATMLPAPHGVMFLGIMQKTHILGRGLTPFPDDHDQDGAEILYHFENRRKGSVSTCCGPLTSARPLFRSLKLQMSGLS